MRFHVLETCRAHPLGLQSLRASNLTSKPRPVDTTPMEEAFERKGILKIEELVTKSESRGFEFYITYSLQTQASLHRALENNSNIQYRPFVVRPPATKGPWARRLRPRSWQARGLTDVRRRYLRQREAGGLFNTKP